MNYSTFIGLTVMAIFAACGPQTKNIILDNEDPLSIKMGLIREPGKSLTFRETYAYVYWDVHVILNGVDFGIIEGGTVSSPKAVAIADHLSIDKLEVQQNSKGLYFYIIQNGQKNYFAWDHPLVKDWAGIADAAKDVAKLELEMKQLKPSGEWENKEYTWNISYGFHGNIPAKTNQPEQMPSS